LKTAPTIQKQAEPHLTPETYHPSSGNGLREKINAAINPAMMCQIPHQAVIIAIPPRP
jgi:hypothetical protein